MRALLSLLPALLLSACLTPRAAREAEHSKELGTAYLTEGNNPQAITEFRRAAAKNRWDADSWQGLGMALFAAGELDDAEAALLHAIDLAPTMSQARMNLGSLYLEMERWDDAIARFLEVLADPEYREAARARHNLGWAYFSKGDFPEARESYVGVLRQFPKFCPSLRDLGGVDEAEGRLQDALTRYQQAQECDPSDLRGLVALGILEARLDLVHDACLHLDLVKEADPFGVLREQAIEYLQRLDCGT